MRLPIKYYRQDNRNIDFQNTFGNPSKKEENLLDITESGMVDRDMQKYDSDLTVRI